MEYALYKVTVNGILKDRDITKAYCNCPKHSLNLNSINILFSCRNFNSTILHRILRHTIIPIGQIRKYVESHIDSIDVSRLIIHSCWSNALDIWHTLMCITVRNQNLTNLLLTKLEILRSVTKEDYSKIYCTMKFMQSNLKN